jgi:hypothetical protein
MEPRRPLHTQLLAGIVEAFDGGKTRDRFR